MPSATGNGGRLPAGRRRTSKSVPGGLARRTPRRRRITAAIRSPAARRPGKLGAEDREFTRLVQVDASEAERGQATTYRPGDVIQFHQNAKGGFTKGERLTVTDPAAVPLDQAAQVLALPAGERSRWRRATGSASPARSRRCDGEHTLKNGDSPYRRRVHAGRQHPAR